MHNKIGYDCRVDLKLFTNAFQIIIMNNCVTELLLQHKCMNFCFKI